MTVPTVLVVALGIPIGALLGGGYVAWLYRNDWLEGYRAGHEDAELDIDISDQLAPRRCRHLGHRWTQATTYMLGQQRCSRWGCTARRTDPTFLPDHAAAEPQPGR